MVRYQLPATAGSGQGSSKLAACPKVLQVSEPHTLSTLRRVIADDDHHREMFPYNEQLIEVVLVCVQVTKPIG